MVKFSFKRILVKLIFIFWIFGSRTVYFELKFKSKIYKYMSGLIKSKDQLDNIWMCIQSIQYMI